MDGWNTMVSFWEGPFLRGELLVSGRVCRIILKKIFHFSQQVFSVTSCSQQMVVSLQEMYSSSFLVVLLFLDTLPETN